MERLYAPWRTQYITQEDKIDGCVFCYIANSTQKEDENLGVLYRGKDFFIVMNKYPYSPGHFMIIPNKHECNLEHLDPILFAKMSNFAQKGVKLLKDILNAQGVNIGLNLHKAAGAGIEEHIHMHLIPRWIGDTNFITTIGETRVYGTEFQKLYKKLKDASKDYFR